MKSTVIWLTTQHGLYKLREGLRPAQTSSGWPPAASITVNDGIANFVKKIWQHYSQKNP